jgi:hypothetical protein
MWMYPGPSCPDCPFSEELDNAEINTRIHKVPAHGANLNPGFGPTPLEGRGRLQQGEFARTHSWLFSQISISQCAYVLV